MSEDPDFKYIIRIANSDVSGEQRLGYALTSIRGIGPRISNAIIKKLSLDSEKLAGELSDKNVDEIENAIKNVSEFVPKWLLNRQKDYDTGDDVHSVSIDLKMALEDDINRMKKTKSYKGVRHASGHKVRGQRTYSNGRRGLALGVSKSKGKGA